MTRDEALQAWRDEIVTETEQLRHLEHLTRMALLEFPQHEDRDLVGEIEDALRALTEEHKKVEAAKAVYVESVKAIWARWGATAR